MMKSLIKIWEWFDDRTGIAKALKTVLVEHKVPKGSTWLYVFGSATLVAFIIQIITGIALATIYAPSPDGAYQSLQFITNNNWISQFVRALHYWGMSAMVMLLGIHLIRVFLTGAFRYPREMHWISGVVLLGLTVGNAFTGQLLRWDQNAVWTAVVVAEQAARIPFIGGAVAHFALSGDFIGAATLSHFFSYHVFVFPGLLIAVIGFHLYLVLRNGISEPAKAGRPVDPKKYRAWYQDLLKREGRPFWPDVMWHDVAFGFFVIVAVTTLAAVFGPPALSKPPNPSIIDALPRPDWYMMWYFAVLALSPHTAEPYIMVGAPLLGTIVLLLVPFLKKGGGGERHPLKRPWAVAATLMIVMSLGTLWVQGVHAPWSPDFTAKPLPVSVIGDSTGFVFEGAQLMHKKGCLYCHNIAGDGGHRGPELTHVADRLTEDQMTVRIMNGGYNMPAFAGSLSAEDLEKILAFLKTRKSH
ncbi:MAG: cytochrome b N-terminal domain-containing protein [Calditrichia bacterium]